MKRTRGGLSTERFLLFSDRSRHARPLRGHIFGPPVPTPLETPSPAMAHWRKPRLATLWTSVTGKRSVDRSVRRRFHPRWGSARAAFLGLRRSSRASGRDASNADADAFSSLKQRPLPRHTSQHHLYRSLISTAKRHATPVIDAELGRAEKGGLSRGHGSADQPREEACGGATAGGPLRSVLG